MDKKKIIISKNGPYIVSGNIPLDKESIVTDDQNYPVEYSKGQKYPKKGSYALCRCGHSKNKPFCDWTHEPAEFNGSEKKSARKTYLQMGAKIDGPKLVLTDAEDLCWGAGFCHTKHGSTWELTKESDNPESKEIAIKSACNCPSGRLVIWDKKKGNAIEPKFKPSITILEDQDGLKGPIYVKGSVLIKSADGFEYEKRNRVCLCRCGKSSNKPYCDGAHFDAVFDD